MSHAPSVATETHLRRGNIGAFWLPGLDGVRALAALAVVIHHEEQAREFVGLPNVWRENFAVVHLGSLGVSLFFVLSGFLITLLLLREYDCCGEISVRKFYIRRILRIWPLYYFVVFLGFLIIPHFDAFGIDGFPKQASEHFWKKLALYVVFAPQVAAATVGPMGYAGVLWSVGVEEWFYLIWPWVVVRLRRWLAPLLLMVIFIFGYVRWHLQLQLEESWLRTLFIQLRFDCMAVGALGALICSSQQWRQLILNSPLFSRPAQIVGLATLLYCLWIGKHFFEKDEVIYCTLFLWLIINVSYNNKNSIVNLDVQPLRFIGKVSYGIYCYNWIAIVTSLLLLRTAGVNPDHGFARAFSYVFGIALSIAAAAFSFKVIERPFLAWKERSFEPGIPVSRSGRSEGGGHAAHVALQVIETDGVARGRPDPASRQ